MDSFKAVGILHYYIHFAYGSNNQEYVQYNAIEFFIFYAPYIISQPLAWNDDAASRDKHRANQRPGKSMMTRDNDDLAYHEKYCRE